MPKHSPIEVVNKTRKPRKTSTGERKKVPSSSSRKSSGKRKKQVAREMPRWFYYILAAFIIIVFLSVFYFFFIRPYAYRWKPCYGYKGYGVCIPDGYEVHGIDVSHFQGRIDWEELTRNQMALFPLEFVFIKATEGGDLDDDTFTTNFESARKHGFIRGAYHFYNPATSALKQADFFIDRVRLIPGDLPPVLDIERTGRKDVDELRRELKLWLDKIEEHYGVKPILYTSYKFKTKYLNDSVFNSYPYWIAHYYVDSVEYKGEWKFWQHTDAGLIQGIPEEVDLNIYNGTLEELKQLTIPK